MPVTDTPPDPAAALLQLIEALCAAIAQYVGGNLFARLLMIPVRRQLRGMADVVSEVIADAAARAPDMTPIFVPMDPPDAPPNTAASIGQTIGATAAPVPSPAWEAETVPHHPRTLLPADGPGAPSGADALAAACPMPDAATAPVMAETGGCAARMWAAPVRNQAAFPSPPPVAPAVAARCAAAHVRHRPAIVQKTAPRAGVLRALFVMESEHYSP